MYTFSPNTKIKSSEVNANFTGVANGSELPNKTIQFFILNNEANTSGNTNYGDSEASSDKELCFRFNYSLYTNIQSIIFRAVLYGVDAGTFYARLYNHTDGTALNNSEISTTVLSDSYNWLDSADCKADFVAGIKTYKVQLKQTSVGQTQIHKPQLIITWK